MSNVPRGCGRREGGREGGGGGKKILTEGREETGEDLKMGGGEGGKRGGPGGGRKRAQNAPKCPFLGGVPGGGKNPEKPPILGDLHFWVHKRST